MPIEVVVKKEKYSYRIVPSDKSYPVDQTRLSQVQTLQDVQLYKTPKTILTTINPAGDVVKEKIKFPRSTKYGKSDDGPPPRTLVGAKIWEQIEELAPARTPNHGHHYDPHARRKHHRRHHHPEVLNIADPALESALATKFDEVISSRKAGSKLDKKLKEAKKSHRDEIELSSELSRQAKLGGSDVVANRINEKSIAEGVQFALESAEFNSCNLAKELFAIEKKYRQAKSGNNYSDDDDDSSMEDINASLNESKSRSSEDARRHNNVFTTVNNALHKSTEAENNFSDVLSQRLDALNVELRRERVQQLNAFLKVSSGLHSALELAGGQIPDVPPMPLRIQGDTVAEDSSRDPNEDKKTYSGLDFVVPFNQSGRQRLLTHRKRVVLINHVPQSPKPSSSKQEKPSGGRSFVPASSHNQFLGGSRSVPENAILNTNIETQQPKREIRTPSNQAIAENTTPVIEVDRYSLPTPMQEFHQLTSDAVASLNVECPLDIAGLQSGFDELGSSQSKDQPVKIIATRPSSTMSEVELAPPAPEAIRYTGVSPDQRLYDDDSNSGTECESDANSDSYVGSDNECCPSRENWSDDARPAAAPMKTYTTHTAGPTLIYQSSLIESKNRLQSYGCLAHHPKSTPYSHHEMHVAAKRHLNRSSKGIHFQPKSAEVVASITDPLQAGLTFEELEKLNETEALAAASIKMRRAMARHDSRKVEEYKKALYTSQESSIQLLNTCATFNNARLALEEQATQALKEKKFLQGKFISGRIARTLATETKLVGRRDATIAEVVLGAVIAPALQSTDDIDDNDDASDDRSPSRRNSTRVTFMTEPINNFVENDKSSRKSMTITTSNDLVTAKPHELSPRMREVINDSKPGPVVADTKRAVSAKVLTGRNPYGDNHHLNFQHFTKLHNKIIEEYDWNHLFEKRWFFKLIRRLKKKTTITPPPLSVYTLLGTVRNLIMLEVNLTQVIVYAIVDKCIQPKDHQNSVVFDIVYGLSRHVNIDAEELYNHIVENNIEPAPRLKLMMDKILENKERIARESQFIPMTPRGRVLTTFRPSNSMRLSTKALSTEDSDCSVKGGGKPENDQAMQLQLPSHEAYQSGAIRKVFESLDLSNLSADDFNASDLQRFVRHQNS